MRVSRELSLFSTPWHWLVHGLGLGQSPRGFEARRAQRTRELSQALVRRFGAAHAFTDALVQASAGACESPGLLDRASLVARLSAIAEPGAHARACALTIESLVKLEALSPGTHVLESEWRRALAQVTALPEGGDGDGYHALHAIAGLLLAAGQAGWSGALGSPAALRAIEHAFALSDAIAQPFYRARGAAMLATVLGVLGAGARLTAGDHDRVAELVGLHAEAFQREPAQASDGVHVDRDYRLFPLSLTLSALAVLGRLDWLRRRPDWLALAAHEVRALGAASRASQALFWIAALRNLGVLERFVPDPSIWVSDTIEDYLEHTDGCRPDDYLRCTYLVHLARQLGCLDLVPARVGMILANAVARVGEPRDRANPYGSGFMVIAYVLSAVEAGAPGLEALDLAGAVERLDEDAASIAVGLPRLGYALADAALKLRPHDAGDTRLFLAVRLHHAPSQWGRHGDRQWA